MTRNICIVRTDPEQRCMDRDILIKTADDTKSLSNNADYSISCRQDIKLSLLRGDNVPVRLKSKSKRDRTYIYTLLQLLLYRIL